MAASPMATWNRVTLRAYLVCRASSPSDSFDSLVVLASRWVVLQGWLPEPDPLDARDEHTGDHHGKQRKTWSTDVKEAIVLSVLRGELGVAEAARQHGVNESLIHTWKAQFLEAGRARVLCRTAPVWGLPASPVTVRIKA